MFTQSSSSKSILDLWSIYLLTIKYGSNMNFNRDLIPNAIIFVTQQSINAVLDI